MRDWLVKSKETLKNIGIANVRKNHYPVTKIGPQGRNPKALRSQTC